MARPARAQRLGHARFPLLAVRGERRQEGLGLGDGGAVAGQQQPVVALPHAAARLRM